MDGLRSPFILKLGRIRLFLPTAKLGLKMEQHSRAATGGLSPAEAGTLLRRRIPGTLATFLALASLIPMITGIGLAEPNRLPDVPFRSLDGATVALSDLRGKVVLINFWGTWCAPCLQEIPELVRLSHQFRQRGLEVLGVAVDSGRPEDIRKFLVDHGMDYRIVIGDLSVVKNQFSVFGFPTSLLVDRQGRLHRRYFGPQTAAVLTRDVELLLSRQG